ncbi:MAG: ABC transporter ATP-binding protein [Burkholderiales bacterium]
MIPESAHGILQAEGLTKQFPVGGLLSRNKRVVHALTDVSMTLNAGETVGIVGESGCGKSTLARCLLHLIEPTHGRVLINGRDAGEMLRSDPLAFRRAVQIVFQDPYASLNPRRTIGQSVSDPLRIFGMKAQVERQTRTAELLRMVGLLEEFAARYPHDLSGGQRQRVAIVRALAPSPRVIVCDEAVSSLDVSIQARITNLLRDIQAQTKIGYIFISHNLHLVQRIADRIIVIYLGQIVESGAGEELRARLLHPYSQALFAAAPVLRRDGVARIDVVTPPLQDEVPSPIDPPSGCRFHPRCGYRQAICSEIAPNLEMVGDRCVRCHFAHQIAAASGDTTSIQE